MNFQLILKVIKDVHEDCYSLWLFFGVFLLLFPETRFLKRLETCLTDEGEFQGKDVCLKVFDFYLLAFFFSVNQR